jgi:hypothetical protein
MRAPNLQSALLIEKSELDRSVGFVNAGFMKVQRQVTYPILTRGCTLKRLLVQPPVTWQWSTSDSGMVISAHKR